MTSIKLASSRVAQLKQIAAARGIKTVTDLIATWVNSEIDKGTIAPGIPGFTIRSGDEGIVVNSGAWDRTLSLDLARDFTDALRKAAGGSHSENDRPSAGTADRSIEAEIDKINHSVDFSFVIRRRGRRIDLTDRISGHRQTVSISAAEDIAKLIDAEIDSYQRAI